MLATDVDAERCVSECGDAAARCARLDVTQQSDWEEIMGGIADSGDRLDGLVNCASICVSESICALTLEDFRRQNDVNAVGTFRGVRAAVASMRSAAAKDKPARGSIVNVTNIAAQMGVPGGAGIAAAAGAVKNLCKTVAVECGELGDEIRVNSVQVGVLEGDANWVRGRQDDPPRVSPDDAASAVVYLLSDESRLVTGSHITVDAGLTQGLSI